MTIKLLTDWPYKRASGAGYVTMPAGAVVGVFDAATEAGMIAAKVALASGAGADWLPPSDAGVYNTFSDQQVASILGVVSTPGNFLLTPRLIGGGVDIAGSRTITNAGPIVLGSVLIPGGSIGAVGMLRIRGRWVSSSNVTNKTFTVTLGGVTLMTSGPGLAGNIIWPFDYIIINRGSESSQSWHPSAAGSIASANTAIGTSTVNTAIDQTLELRGTVVTESLTLEYFSVEVQRFA